MGTRLELQTLLEDILGSRNVYYQPPASVIMKYPAIVYNRADIEIFHANNLPYAHAVAYQVILIDKNPDSEYVNKIAMLPLCRYDRHYVSYNLNHDVFTLYY